VGGNFSAAGAINARGWIVGFSQTGEVDPLTGGLAGHAVLWNNNSIIDLGTLDTGVESSGWYVKNGGQVVGIAAIDTTFDPFACFGPFCSPTHAFTWKNGVLMDLGTLGGPDSFVSGGCNLQREDLVPGTSYKNSIPNPDTGFPTADPFLWENGKMKDLGTLGGTFGTAQCANNRGQVIGQSSLTEGACFTGTPGCHAFLWNGTAMTDLGTLGGTFSVPIWLNEKGEAVGGATTANDALFHATLWRDGAITDLGTLPGDCGSIAWAINSKSQIVGQSFNCDTNISETVLWDKGSIFDLGVASTEPLNINDQGEITGVYLPAGCDNSDSCGHGFVLIPCAGGQGCKGKNRISAQIESPAITTTLNQRREMTKAFVTRLRARLAQRYHIPSLQVQKD
jgi:probable HAF family extracellular repeat protein